MDFQKEPIENLRGPLKLYSSL